VLGVASAYAFGGHDLCQAWRVSRRFLQSDWVLALSALLIAFMGDFDAWLF